MLKNFAILTLKECLVSQLHKNSCIQITMNPLAIKKCKDQIFLELIQKFNLTFTAFKSEYLIYYSSIILNHTFLTLLAILRVNEYPHFAQTEPYYHSKCSILPFGSLLSNISPCPPLIITIIITFLYDGKIHENGERDRKCEQIIESKGIIEPFGPLKLRNSTKIAVNRVIFFSIIGLSRVSLSSLAEFSTTRFQLITIFNGKKLAFATYYTRSLLKVTCKCIKVKCFITLYFLFVILLFPTICTLCINQNQRKSFPRKAC